mmetsp:Transcript_25122/g.69454  ORF Transcript_25122/g.69454 Transcript_25122/m.69454 type:complete len:201 (+) Transcript_25122:109-711(+)|eukprot:CAMPEP_0168744718 /NCGR_PEP_ID=MMETSP0724-20121128/14239_1 /TAXON_ID=265536 /ORGANISM="Amphiprora sp., Strain CCMP467" /LENGTH=200 /DNA_ID=CAMNT_0008792393 /DNA_START=98 /DNA_END=700 /DNA_ORIENTATION=-
MKIAVALSLVAGAAAFSQEASRREAISTGAAAVGAAFLPAAANAAAGESPRFSVFGLIGDGGAYSEGAAYGSDQAAPLYSPYSVYGDVGGDGAIYDPSTKSFAERKKAVLAETAKRVDKLPSYIEKKQWFNVRDELTRYMYETRGAMKGLASTPEQKAAATAFFKAIEATDGAARVKDGEACMAAAKASAATLKAFTASL